MRGVASLLAAISLWVLVTRRLPDLEIRLPRRRAIAAGSGFGLGAWLLVGGLGVEVIALAVALLAFLAPIVAERARTNRDRELMAEQLPDFLARVRGRLAGGESLPEAAVAAGRAGGGRMAEIAESIGLAIRQGSAFPDALTAARAAVHDPLADRVLVVLASAHAAGGGHVASVLGVLSRSVADELQLRRAHRAAMTQQRLTALVSLIAPWALLLLTIATNPLAADAYRTADGTAIVGIGLAATLGGYTIASRTAELRRPRKVFQ